ncbi:MAG: hypothetical protein HAW67_02585 [Endozoicomonadaceae bacterium]|nr:hypothetical protein [Endozoicomonadaceae bacterium]
MIFNQPKAVSSYPLAGETVSILPPSLAPRHILKTDELTLFSPRNSNSVQFKDIKTSDLRFIDLQNNFLVDFKNHTPSMDLYNQFTVEKGNELQSMSKDLIDFASHVLFSELIKTPRNKRGGSKMTIDSIRNALQEPARNFKPQRAKPKTPSLSR